MLNEETDWVRARDLVQQVQNSPPNQQIDPDTVSHQHKNLMLRTTWVTNALIEMYWFISAVITWNLSSPWSTPDFGTIQCIGKPYLSRIKEHLEEADEEKQFPKLIITMKKSSKRLEIVPEASRNERDRENGEFQHSRGHLRSYVN